ncbi:MAG: hypothetical protein WKF47_19210 [Geodermatophilaceae bacterium]
MCAGAMTAVTTTASGIAFGAYDVAVAGGVEHMGHHPMGEGVDPNPRFLSEKLVDPSALVMGQTAENLHDRYPAPDQGTRRRVRRGQPGEVREGGGQRPDRPGPGHRWPPAPRPRATAWPPSTSRRGRKPPSRACPRSRPRSVRTAGSPPATPPGSTTARPRA